MAKIDFEKVATDESLYEQYRTTFQNWFNMQLTRGQYVEFVDICKERTTLYLNPFSMCAYLLKKPIETIVDRFFEKGRENDHTRT